MVGMKRQREIHALDFTVARIVTLVEMMLSRSSRFVKECRFSKMGAFDVALGYFVRMSGIDVILEKISDDLRLSEAKVAPLWWPEGSSISIQLQQGKEKKVTAVIFHVPQIGEFSDDFQVVFIDSAPFFLNFSNMFRKRVPEEEGEILLEKLRNEAFPEPPSE